MWDAMCVCVGAQAVPLGYVAKEDIFAACKAILATQRDYGRRDDRKQSRLKYLVSRWGVDKFRSVCEQYMGTSFQPEVPLPPWKLEQYHGWIEQGDGKLAYGARSPLANHPLPRARALHPPRQRRWNVCTLGRTHTASVRPVPSRQMEHSRPLVFLPRRSRVALPSHTSVGACGMNVCRTAGGERPPEGRDEAGAAQHHRALRAPGEAHRQPGTLAKQLKATQWPPTCCSLVSKPRF